MILSGDCEEGQLHIQEAGQVLGCGQEASWVHGRGGSEVAASRVLSSPEAPQRGHSCPQVPAACSGGARPLPRPLTSGQKGRGAG